MALIAVRSPPLVCDPPLTPALDHQKIVSLETALSHHIFWLPRFPKLKLAEENQLQLRDTTGHFIHREQVERRQVQQCFRGQVSTVRLGTYDTKAHTLLQGADQTIGLWHAATGDGSGRDTRRERDTKHTTTSGDARCAAFGRASRNRWMVMMVQGYVKELCLSIITFSNVSPSHGSVRQSVSFSVSRPASQSAPRSVVPSVSQPLIQSSIPSFVPRIQSSSQSFDRQSLIPSFGRPVSHSVVQSVIRTSVTHAQRCMNDTFLCIVTAHAGVTIVHIAHHSEDRPCATIGRGLMKD